VADETANHDPESGDRTYEAPGLTVLGEVEELTRSVQASLTDTG
jgi:hypothetical protein